MHRPALFKAYTVSRCSRCATAGATAGATTGALKNLEYVMEGGAAIAVSFGVFMLVMLLLAVWVQWYISSKTFKLKDPQLRAIIDTAL